MQWKKLDKEGRGIDQRRHLTSPPSPVSVRLTLEESAERLARWCFAVTTHRPGSQSTRCKHPLCSSLQLCSSALHRALQQARAASDGEYESAAAVCWRVPVQKYKLQAATDTFLLEFLLQIWPVGGADAQPSPLNIALFALLARTSKDDGFAAKLFGLEKI